MMGREKAGYSKRGDLFKKMMSVLFSLALIFTMIPAQALAAEPGTATGHPTIISEPAAAAYYAQDEQAEGLVVVAEAPEDGTLSYQWYSNTIASTDGAQAISGATASVYTPSTSTMGITYYFCEITAEVPGTDPGTASINSSLTMVEVATLANVTFDYNYTEAPQAHIARIAIDRAFGPNMPQDPTRSGFKFLGWNTASNGSGDSFSDATIVSADMSVYAQWQKAQSTKKITRVTINGVEGEIYQNEDDEGGNIYFALPYGTDRSSLLPEIEHNGMSHSPIEAQNFGDGGIQYTITAEDGSTCDYWIQVNFSNISATEFGTWIRSGTVSSIVSADKSKFQSISNSEDGSTLVEGQDYTVREGDEEGTTLITLTQSYLGTLDEGYRYFNIYYSDGSAWVYVSIIGVEQLSAKDITGVGNGYWGNDIYSFGESGIVLAFAPSDIDLTSVKPVVECSPGATYAPTEARDFSNGPVEYTVTAIDGSTKRYQVHIIVDSYWDPFGTWKGNGSIRAITSMSATSFEDFFLSYGVDGSSAKLTRDRDYTVTEAEDDEAEDDRTVITLSEDYLKTLEYGNYTFVSLYSGGIFSQHNLTATSASPKDITKLSINGVEAEIWPDGNSIEVSLPYQNYDNRALQPVIECSSGATYGPRDPQDFSDGPVTYTVTAADGTTKDYYVYVSHDTIPTTGPGAWAGTGSVIIATGIDKTKFTSLHVESSVETYSNLQQDQDFVLSGDSNNTVIELKESWLRTLTVGDCRVTAFFEGGLRASADFAITALDASDAKDITSFVLGGTVASIQESVLNGSTILVTLPYGTNLAGLTPVIECSPGASYDPTGPQRFSTDDSSVTYTVTAANNTTKTYPVYVYYAPISADDFGVWEGSGSVSSTIRADKNDFLHLNRAANGPDSMIGDFDWVDDENYTIAAKNGTTIITLNESYLQTLSVGEYSFKAQYDGGSTNSMLLTIAAPGNSPAKNIASFTLAGLAATISGTNIAASVPYGTDVTSLIPTIVAPTTATVSPTDAQNFTNPVSYTVTAEDGSTKVYTVTVTVEATPKVGVTFNDNYAGAPTAQIVRVEVGETLASAMPQNPFRSGFKFLGWNTATDGSGDNFNDATIVSADISVCAQWQEAQSFREITRFAINGVEGGIYQNGDGEGGSISLWLPYGTDRSNLLPDIEHDGISHYPIGAQDFSGDAIRYTITAEDGSTCMYKVSVYISSIPATELGVWFGSGTVSSTVSADRSKFESINNREEDNALVEDQDYTALEGEEEGTTLITLNQSYLGTLSEGDHYFTIYYTDGSADVYLTVLGAEQLSAKDITYFDVDGWVGDISSFGENGIVLARMPDDIDLTLVEPFIECSLGAICTPTGAQDFSDGPVEYTVTAVDGSTKRYQVLAIVDLQQESFGTWKGGGSISVTVSMSATNLEDFFMSYGPDGFGAKLIKDRDYTILEESEDEHTQIAITLSEDYLRTLEYGNYSFTALYSGNIASQHDLTATSASPKDITRLSINGVEAEVWPDDTYIYVSLPYQNYDNRSLEPVIECSSGAICSPTGPQDFSYGSVTYTVTAADGTTKNYEVSVSHDRIPTTGSGVWAGTGNVSIAMGIDKEKFVSLQVEGGMEEYYDLREGRDFVLSGDSNNTVIELNESWLRTLSIEDYQATAFFEGGLRVYADLVITALDASDAKDITSFALEGVEATIEESVSYDSSISVTLAYGTSLTGLTPVIECSPGASYSPEGPQDFGLYDSVTYTVTAANNTTKSYPVYVYYESVSADNFGVWSGSGSMSSTIYADMSNFQYLSCDTTAPDGTISYSEPIQDEDYTIAAKDGNTTITLNENYLKTLSVGEHSFDARYDGAYANSMLLTISAKSSAKDITSFSAAGVAGTISGTNITVNVPYGTSVTSLAPTVVASAKATVSPAGAQNFTSPVKYTVTAEDGSTKVYTVTVVVAAPPKVSVTFNYNYVGSPAATVVQVEKDKTLGSALPANPSRSGYTFKSWNTKADGSGVAFSAATAVSVNTSVYAIWQAVLSSAKDITSFKVANVAGTISGTNITVNVSYGTSVTSLTPAVVASAKATVSPAGAQNFTNPVKYTVKAEDGSTKVYTITVVVAAPPKVVTPPAVVTPPKVVTPPEVVTPPKVSVTFNYNYVGSPAATVVQVEKGKALGSALPANPARTGYAFKSWNTQANGKGAAFGLDTVVNADSVVYAQWEIKVKTVKTQATLALVKGKTATVPAAVQPYNATNKKVSFKSSKPKIVSVNAKTGKVKALKAGKAVITITSEDGKKTAKCTITVVAKTVKIKALAALKPVGLLVGKTAQIKPKVTPAKATGVIYTYKSSKKAGATIDKAGVITALKMGTTTITVKAGGKTQKFTVTVGKVLPTKITLNKRSVSLKAKATAKLVAKLTPTKANPKTVTWTTSNKRVATVTSKGVVKGVKKGKCTIIATTWNGKTVKCNVTVR